MIEVEKRKRGDIVFEVCRVVAVGAVLALALLIWGLTVADIPSKAEIAELREQVTILSLEIGAVEEAISPMYEDWQNVITEASEPECANDTAETVNEKSYDVYDVVILAQMVWGEARGCAPEEQSLCVWTVFNRLKAGGWGGSIAEIVTRPGQFDWDPSYPVIAETRDVVIAALEDWAAGKDAPVLPPYATDSDYVRFSGDGFHNYFK
jgi:hypothetical protein